MDFDAYEQDVMYASPWRTKDIGEIRTGFASLLARYRPDGMNEWQERWLKAWLREVDLVAALDEPTRTRFIANVNGIRDIYAENKYPAEPGVALAEVSKRFAEIGEVLDERCPSYLVALEGRAHYYTFNADLPAAMADKSRLTKLRVALLGTNNPLHASDLEGLGNAANALNRFDEAERHYTECLKLRRRWLSADSYLIAACEYNLGVSDVKQLRYEKAIERFGRVVAANQRANAADDGGTYHHLGIAYGKTGKHLEAAACFDQAKSIYKRTTPPTHPMRLTLLEDQLAFYESTMQPDKAKATQAELEELKTAVKRTR